MFTLESSLAKTATLWRRIHWKADLFAATKWAKNHVASSRTIANGYFSKQEARKKKKEIFSGTMRVHYVQIPFRYREMLNAVDENLRIRQYNKS